MRLTAYWKLNKNSKTQPRRKNNETQEKRKQERPDYKTFQAA